MGALQDAPIAENRSPVATACEHAGDPASAERRRRRHAPRLARLRAPRDRRAVNTDSPSTEACVTMAADCRRHEGVEEPLGASRR
jgi:hypothetical protein